MVEEGLNRLPFSNTLHNMLYCVCNIVLCVTILYFVYRSFGCQRKRWLGAGRVRVRGAGGKPRGR